MLDVKELSDQKLLELLKLSSHAAFTEIYDRYFELLYVHAHKKLRDEYQAQDIVQELFADLWSRRDALGVAKDLPAYLITAIKHRIFDFFEHQKVVSKYIVSIKEYINTGSIAHTDYLTRERQLKSYIEIEIQALPAKMRQIFELSRKEHLTNRKIAEKLNTTESNVSQHLSNAIKALRTKLGSIFSVML